MRQVFTIVILFFFFGLYGQDLRFLAIDTTQDLHTQIYSSSSTVSSEGDEICHSYVYNIGYDNFREILGHLKINIRDQDGNLIHQDKSEDTLFIRNILFKKDGGKIYLGRSLQTLNFLGIDTAIEFSIFDQTRSFILETDAEGNTVDFDIFHSIGSATLDKEKNVLYFADNSNTLDSITIYKKDLNTKLLSPLSLIYTQQRNEELQILLTKDYIYVSGGFLGHIATFGDTLIDSGFDYNTFVAQFKKSGQFNWIRIVEDITLFKTNLAPAPDQGVYFNAPLGFSTKIGDQQMNGPNWGGDFFLTRLDAAGNFLWALECPELKLVDFGLGSGDAIGSDGEYNVYVAGSSRTGLQWDTNTFIGRQFNGHISTLLVFNKEGQLIGNKVASTDDHNRTNSIEVKPNGDFIISGYFDTSIGYEDEVKQLEGSHAYLASFKNFILSDKTTTEKSSDFNFYPNPASNELNIINTSVTASRLSISDIFGRIVLQNNMAEKEIKLNIGHLNPGIYFIKINGSIPQKLVIVK